MPFIKMWIHLVWATKKRIPLLTKDMRQLVCKHIKDNGLGKGIHVDFVNGHIDHVHRLISFTTNQTIAMILQLLKGGSFFWIYKNKLSNEQFKWQDEFFAVSLSESGMTKVREYIKNKEAIHAKKTFQEEYEEFMKRYGCALMKG